MSGMSDADVQGQISHMISFIDQEACEKVEEIDLKAEEEFNIEKGRLVQQSRVQIIDYYDKKIKNVELQKKIQNSNMQNNARLEILRRKEEYVKEVQEEAREKLKKVIRDNPKEYERLLSRLIMQALARLIESKVTIRCRREDVKLIESFVPGLQKEYKELLKGKFSLELVVDQEKFLSPEICGGVELHAMSGKIVVVNTLDERLKLVSQQMMPKIRETLFGTNPNRKFVD